MNSMRGRSFCQIFLASILMLLNFLQAFVGVLIAIYSVWIIDHSNDGGDRIAIPWFSYVLMGIGVVMCLFSFIGYVAAETFSGCLFGFGPHFLEGVARSAVFFSDSVLLSSIRIKFLSNYMPSIYFTMILYALLSSIVILAEGALVGYIILDKNWEEDLPNDPSGEIGRLRAFIEANFGVFRWAGVTVVVIQALSLLLAIILQTMASNGSSDSDSDEDYDDYPTRSPLLTHYARAQV